MAGVRSHRDLVVWQLCNELEETLAPLLRRPAFQSESDLQQQMIRASQRPCPNIAEGFGRFYPRDNARLVRIARGSLNELLDHLERARSRGVLQAAEAEPLVKLANRAAGAATRYLRYLETTDHPTPPGERRRTRQPRTRNEP